jgi:hypothetical protein
MHERAAFDRRIAMGSCLRNSVAIMGITTTFAVARPSVAAAETFHCANEDVACLIFAINDANSDTHEKSTIWLEPGGTYTLTSVDNNTDGPNGLPSITGDLTIRVKGKGTATLTRVTGLNTPPFRLLHVAETGHLRLRDLVLSNGSALFPFGPPPGPTGFEQDGGGIFNSGGEVTLDETTLSGNIAGALGGGLFSSGIVTINKSTFMGNEASSGAGLSSSGVVTIKGSAFTGNNDREFGGAVFNSGQMTIVDSTVDQNVGFGVGGLSNENGGTMSIFKCRITNNGAAAGVGGLSVSGGSVWISETTFAGNAAEGPAALNASQGSVVITESAFDGNEMGTPHSPAVNVGGLARADVTNTTFSRNLTLPVLGNFGVLVLTNATFGENIGHPLSFFPNAVLISSPGATTILQNTILVHDADDMFTQDCDGAVISRGNNIIGDPTGCTITLQPGDLTGNPGLDLFTDDGKPGHGHFPLLPTSPAIGAGNTALCPSDDQLDHKRKGRCDIGAIEFRPH